MKSMGGQKLTSTVVTIEQNVENQTNQNYFYKTEQILDYGILEPRLKDKKKLATTQQRSEKCKQHEARFSIA